MDCIQVDSNCNRNRRNNKIFALWRGAVPVQYYTPLFMWAKSGVLHYWICHFGNAKMNLPLGTWKSVQFNSIDVINSVVICKGVVLKWSYHFAVTNTITTLRTQSFLHERHSVFTERKDKLKNRAFVSDLLKERPIFQYQIVLARRKMMNKLFMMAIPCSSEQNPCSKTEVPISKCEMGAPCSKFLLSWTGKNCQNFWSIVCLYVEIFIFRNRPSLLY